MWFGLLGVARMRWLIVVLVLCDCVCSVPVQFDLIVPACPEH